MDVLAGARDENHLHRALRTHVDEEKWKALASMLVRAFVPYPPWDSNPEPAD
jgi:hypothetical protein